MPSSTQELLNSSSLGFVQTKKRRQIPFFYPTKQFLIKFHQQYKLSYRTTVTKRIYSRGMEQGYHSMWEHNRVSENKYGGVLAPNGLQIGQSISWNWRFTQTVSAMMIEDAKGLFYCLTKHCFLAVSLLKQESYGVDCNMAAGVRRKMTSFFH